MNMRGIYIYSDVYRCIYISHTRIHVCGARGTEYDFFLGANYRGVKKDGKSFDADHDWYKKIDQKVLKDCCQLVKSNSIKGNKQNDVTVVFTPGIFIAL